MPIYKKPYLTFEQQLELLKSRGLEITNDLLALEYLKRIGYYRLSGYTYSFRKVDSFNPSLKNVCRGEEFIAGTKFQHVLELYIFDKKLRLLCLDAIERLEIAFRVDIASFLGAKDPFAYLNPDLLHGNFTKKIDPKTGITRYQEWLKKHETLIHRSKEDFVTHYQNKYGLLLPIWIAIELWDFGLLSNFYHAMKINDKIEIAKKYDIDSQIMESWLRCLNYIRNICAHHSRLWNKNLVDQPKLPKVKMANFPSFQDNFHGTARVYVALCIITYFMSYISPRSSWGSRLKNLINSFPHDAPAVSLKDMGVPEKWEQELTQNYL